MNRWFLWGVVGEDGVGRRGGIGLETLAFIQQRRRGGPGTCGGSVPSHARADTGVSTHLRKLDLVPRSGTKLTAVEGVESRDPLPIILHSILVEWDGSKRVVGWSIAEPVSDRRSVREWLVLEASDDAEVYDREASERRARIALVVIVELLLGTESNFVAICVGVGHSNVLDRDAIQGLEFRRYFDPRWELSEGDTTGYTVFTELELDRRGHCWG